MTDDTAQPAGGEATPTVEDRLASFDFDATPAAQPKDRPAENQEAGDEIDPHDAAAAAEMGADQPDDDDPEINLRDNSKVKLSALKKAYRPDWEKENTEFEAKRKEFEAHTSQFGQRFQTLTQQEQQVSHALNAAITVLQNRMPKPPDESLLETDPFAFQQQQHAYAKAYGDLQQLSQNQRQLAQNVHQRQQQEFGHYVKQQGQLLVTSKPELKDPVKMAKFWQDIKSYGTSIGFTVEEMHRFPDARVWTALADAAWAKTFRERSAKLKEKEKAAQPMPPPTTTPARRVSASEREKVVVRDQLSRLRKTGSAKDGEAFLSNFD